MARLQECYKDFERRIGLAETEKSISKILNEARNIITEWYESDEYPSEDCAKDELILQELGVFADKRVEYLSVLGDLNTHIKVTGQDIDLENLPDIFDGCSHTGETILTWVFGTSVLLSDPGRISEGLGEKYRLSTVVHAIKGNYLGVGKPHLRSDIYYNVKVKNGNEVFIYRDLSKSPR